MENETSQQLENRLAELPEDVRGAVMSVEWEEKVRQIAGKHALHIDQTGKLGDVTLMTMLGLVELGDFSTRIAQELDISLGDATKIGEEIGTEVFTPIRESLKRFTAQAKNAPTTPPAPPAAVASAPPPAPAVPAAPKPDLSAAESLLQAKTVSVPAPAAKPEPPKPGAYATDPYREPPLP